MASEYMFAVGTIGCSTRKGRKASTLLAAASHNRRTIQAELGSKGHIDPNRTALNETIFGPSTPQGVVALATSKMVEAGIDVQKLRKDYTQAIELLFSLPSRAVVDDRKYFGRCLEWTGERFGLTTILSADIHRDESTLHCHVLVSPLVDGKMRGSALVGRAATAELRDSFYRDVAKKFGLSKPTGKMTGVNRAVASRIVLGALESSQDAILRSALWVAVRREIERNPGPYVESLGIELKPQTVARTRTMSQIFTSSGKGPKTERLDEPRSLQRDLKPIGFVKGQAPASMAPVMKPIGFEMSTGEDRNLSCVGFDHSTPTSQREIRGAPNPEVLAPDRRQTATRAQQWATERHQGPQVPVKSTKVAQATTELSEGIYRVRDGDPLPEGW